MIHACDGSGRINLQLTLEEAEMGSHSGDCEADVRYLMSLSHIASQVAEWEPEDVRSNLLEYGAWEEADLLDDDWNNCRTVWLLCGDAVENAREAGEA